MTTLAVELNGQGRLAVGLNRQGRLAVRLNHRGRLAVELDHQGRLAAGLTVGVTVGRGTEPLASPPWRPSLDPGVPAWIDTNRV